AGFEQVVHALVLEREMEGDAALAGAQESQREAAATREAARHGVVEARKTRVTGDGGAQAVLALPTGGLEREPLVEGACVVHRHTLERELGQFFRAPAQVAAELGAQSALEARELEIG